LTFPCLALRWPKKKRRLNISFQDTLEDLLFHPGALALLLIPQCLLVIAIFSGFPAGIGIWVAGWNFLILAAACGVGAFVLMGLSLATGKYEYLDWEFFLVLPGLFSLLIFAALLLCYAAGLAGSILLILAGIVLTDPLLYAALFSLLALADRRKRRRIAALHNR
jgi:hypothetical protein